MPNSVIGEGERGWAEGGGSSKDKTCEYTTEGEGVVAAAASM